MDKIIIYFKKNYYLIAPAIIFLIGFIIKNFRLMSLVGDDSIFPHVLDNQNLWSYLSDRITTWTGRIPMSIMEVTIERIPGLFIFINCVLGLILILLVFKCINSNSIITNLIVVVLFLFLEDDLYASTGFMSVSINYLWPLSFGMYAIYLIYKNLKKESIKIREYVAALFLLVIYTLWEESFAVAFLIIFFLLALIQFCKTKKINAFYMVGFIASLTFVLYAAFWPANHLRYIHTVKYYYPEFANFSFLNKVNLSIIFSYRCLMKPYMIFVLALFTVYVFLRSKNILLRINTIILTCHCIAFSILFKLNNQNVLAFLDTNFYKHPTIIGFMFASVFFAQILISIFCVFIKNENSRIGCSVLLVGGVSTTAMLGFTPAVWATGYRAAIFLAFSTIFFCAYIWNVTWPDLNLIFNKKSRHEN